MVLISHHYHEFTGSDLVTFASGVSSKLNGYALDPTPIITLVTFDGQITALNDTVTARVSDRNTTLERTQLDQEKTVKDSLDALSDQLKFLANQATPGDDLAIQAAIIFVGYRVIVPHGHDAQTFKVIETGSGEATLTTEVPNHTQSFIYLWSYTLTPADANSWSKAIMTTTSRVTLTGLTHDQRGYFRSAIISPLGRNPEIDVNDDQFAWGDVISAMIS